MSFTIHKLFLLASLLLFISLTHCEVTSSDDNTGNEPEPDDDDFDLWSLMGDGDFGDFDFPNMEDFQGLFSKTVRYFDAESLVDTVTESNLVLVLYICDEYPEDVKIYEDFFKTITPYFESGTIQTEVVLGRALVNDDTALAEYYKPANNPSLVLFDHVRMFEYDDELQLPEFFGWFNQIVSREFVELDDQGSLDRFLESDDNPKLVAFYNTRDAQELEILHDIAKKDYLIHLDIRQVAICLEHCTATFKQQSFKRPSLVLFRNFEKTTPYAVLDQHLDKAESIFSFCNYESLPPVIYYDELNQTKLFGEVIKSHITLILDPEADNTNLISAFERSAFYNRDNEPQNQRVVHVVNFFDDEVENLQWFYNVHSTEGLPKLFITETADDLEKIYKYRYESSEPISYESIRGFINDFSERKLARYYISEDAPDNQGKHLNKVVGTTYRNEVIDSDVNYVLYICPDMTDYMCSDPLEIFDKVIQKANAAGLVERGKLRFGHIDALRNEMDMELGDSFPDVRIFKISDKKKPPAFGGYFTEDELFDWVKEQVEQIEGKPKKEVKVDIEL